MVFGDKCIIFSASLFRENPSVLTVFIEVENIPPVSGVSGVTTCCEELSKAEALDGPA